MLSNDAFRGQPVLPGESVRLEPLGFQHADDAWAALGDPELLRLTGTHATFTREQVKTFIQHVSTRDDRADWAIMATRAGRHVGEVVLNQFDPDNAAANNPRAQHVYAKCGFQVEGRRREALHWDGQWYDAIVMGILSTDPR